MRLALARHGLWVPRGPLAVVCIHAAAGAKAEQEDIRDDEQWTNGRAINSIWLQCIFELRSAIQYVYSHSSMPMAFLSCLVLPVCEWTSPSVVARELAVRRVAYSQSETIPVGSFELSVRRKYGQGTVSRPGPSIWSAWVDHSCISKEPQEIFCWFPFGFGRVP